MDLKKISVEDKPLYIYWHICIYKESKERGKYIINRQYKKMKESGLIERSENVYICYVSDIEFPCENIINDPKVKIIVREKSGYEGVTTTNLKKFCDQTTEENLILYIHNRGLSHSENSPSEDWTLMMEFFLIENWRKSIKQLEEKYTCGCEMFSHTDRINSNDFIFHYSGNFWWSRSSYIKLLKYPSFENRWVESEDWVLQLAEHGIPKECFGILHRTSQNRYEQGMVHSYIDRYPSIYYKLCNETPDIEIDKNSFHGYNCKA